MKVDRSKLKKSSSEVPADCKLIIDAIKGLSQDDLLEKLKTIKTWSFGKCELYHWADVLDIFDSILDKACQKESEKKWTLQCDRPGNEELKSLLLEVLRFTALLIEHSFSRHLYNSMDHLATLLTSCDMSAVLQVLNLLYVFSKRSNFISRMSPEKKQGLIQRLVHLAESWGGKENGFGLAECCQDLPNETYPTSATTLHFEFYAENKDEKNKKTHQTPPTVIQSIHMENVDKTGLMPSQIMEEIMMTYNVPEEKQIVLFTHVRLACLFSKYDARVLCVQARLQAISILVYSIAIQENMNVILYPGLIEELVDIVEIKGQSLVDIKSAALRTLTSVIHIERNPRLTSIIDATGASSYHGFLPMLVRTCIQHMIDPALKPFPQAYATSLFSFLYHLASYENGVEALVSCGMMESLLKVISWYGDGQEHITFVTRAVRVIDLITNMDMAAFQGLGGLQTFINRLENEVNLCRIDQPFEIGSADCSMEAYAISPMIDEDSGQPPGDSSNWPQDSERVEGGGGSEEGMASAISSPSETASNANVALPSASTDFAKEDGSELTQSQDKKNKHCFAQRAALLKSMLNFLKKAIPDMSFADSIRHLMDGPLPKSLKHIISNAEYYGPSLFLLATDVVTVYVFQEPSLLSSLQDKGLTDVVLHALLVKDVPATREVLASLPNIFSALCLNARGLEAFVACKPFDRLFKFLLSPDYLPAMRRRRSSDHFGDTASNLGNAMDELMRHQPSLRTDATKAIIKLLEEICSMGQNPHFICQKQQPKAEQASVPLSVRSPQSNEASSSDEEDEEEVEMPHMPASIAGGTHLNASQTKAAPGTQDSMQANERQAIPLMDYVLNVMKFVEAILSNNSTDDHCREFMQHKGLVPLMSILGLPNLPIDFPSSPACQAVSSVCKSILTLSREPQVLKQGLLQMNEVLHQLQPLHQPLEAPGGSVLLRELATCAHMTDATLSSNATPLLHSLSNAHAYIMMFTHVCRMGQIDIRTISVNHWGSDLGLEVLKGLSSLYNSLVWESTVLLALCNEDYLPPNCQFGRADLDKLLSKDAREKNESGEGDSSEDKALNIGSGDQSNTNPVQSGDAMQMDTQTCGEECMDTLEAGSSQPSAPDGSSTQQAERSVSPEARLQHLTVPFSGVTTSISSASVASDNAGAATTTAGGTGTDKEQRENRSPAMQAQLRQLKPLLTLSSRLGRALSELFVLLVKLSVGSPVRQRRSQPSPTPPVPSPAARDVALALTKLLAGGLSFQPPAYSPQPKLRMTFLVCSAGFTAPMLFDEKKQPYHLMLQKFVSCGGQAALFQTFSWALSMDGRVPLSEGLEHPDLPDGTGEFLDSWLNLVQKMINPKSVLDSPHTLPVKGKSPDVTPFDPVHYLLTTHKAAFNAVMNLWDKTPLPVHGARISESVLAILCHIVCGEGMLQKHLEEKEKEAAAAAPVAGTGDIAVRRNLVTWRRNRTAGQLGASGTVYSPLGNFLPTPDSNHDWLLDPSQSQSSSGQQQQAVQQQAGPSSNPAAASTVIASAGPATASTEQPPPESFSSSYMDQLSVRVNLAHLCQLMDMGFTTYQANVALSNTNSIEQATELLLTNPPPETAPVGTFQTGTTNPSTQESADVEMDEEGQMMKAIAMSLGENAIMSTDQPKEEEEKKSPENEEKEDNEPLDRTVLDEFTQNIFPGCLKLLDTLPETVYRVCDLIVVIMIRNGEKWKKDILTSLCDNVGLLCKELTASAQEKNLTKMLDSETSSKFATRLHLLSLLGEEMHQSVALTMQQADLASLLTSLLVTSQTALNNAIGDDTCMLEMAELTPKWLAPLILLLDMREKISVVLKRKIKARIAVGNNRVWKWFDDSSGRWCKYSSSNNATIDEAYKNGDSHVRFQAGRRKYSVQFVTMIQLNEETGNRRPVMLSVPTEEDKVGKKKDQSKEAAQNQQDTEEVMKEFGVEGDLESFMPGLGPETVPVIISALSGFLRIPLTPDCLHATMRLILRLTRQHQYAEQFVSEGGANRLLSLTEESNFQGFLNLATLIFRHILDEPMSLRFCMEKVMRNVCAGMGSCRSGVSQGGVGAKEMHYILRMLGPAACREPQLFSSVARGNLQITILPSAAKDDDDMRYIGPNAPQFLKCNPTKQIEALVNPWIKNFIWDLLNALITSSGGGTTAETTSSKGNFQVFKDGSTIGAPKPTDAASSGQEKQTSAEEVKDAATTSDKTPVNKSKQLIPKSAVLRLLSEIIRSYGNCVQLITQHSYHANQSQLVPESCSVLAFVLDNLLSSGQNVGDKDCPLLARVFIASIASCSLSPDAQVTLVMEVKGALQRALTLPEGSSKHQRIQALANIISTIIESCHTPGIIPNSFFKGQQVINNTVMKILVKKGMLVDLARIPHNLDLSSPFLATTVNSVLKPLETLSRSVNSPDKAVPAKKLSEQTSAPQQGGTSTTAELVTEPVPTAQENNEEWNEWNETSQTGASGDVSQMNVTIEDVTNNLEAQNNLEVTTDHQIAEPETFTEERTELDNLLQQMWESNDGADPETQVVSEMTISQVGGSTAVDDHEILIDVAEEVEDEYDNQHHDSQMVSQVLSDDDEEEGDNDRDEDNQDDVSGDEEDDDYDAEEQEEMGEDDDEEDEDEEDEDDEETSDMEGDGEGDGYTDMRNPFDTGEDIGSFNMEEFSTHARMSNMPPAPSVITNTHPLLMRQPDNSQVRGHRSGRSRLRSIPMTNVCITRESSANNAPIILQRLLGPSTAAEILHLTTTLSNHTSGGTGGTGGPSRVVLAGDNLPFLPRPEDPSLFSELFQDSDETNGVLSCIPSTLTRWTEETKVLDGDAAHDLMTILKPDIVDELVCRRNKELEERKEKKKKAESENKKVDNNKAEGSTDSAIKTASQSDGEGSRQLSIATPGNVLSSVHNQAASMLVSETLLQAFASASSGNSTSVASTTPSTALTSSAQANSISAAAASAAIASSTAPSFFSLLVNSISAANGTAGLGRIPNAGLMNPAATMAFPSNTLVGTQTSSASTSVPGPNQPMTVINRQMPQALVSSSTPTSNMSQSLVSGLFYQGNTSTGIPPNPLAASQQRPFPPASSSSSSRQWQNRLDNMMRAYPETATGTTPTGVFNPPSYVDGGSVTTSSVLPTAMEVTNATGAISTTSTSDPCSATTSDPGAPPHPPSFWPTSTSTTTPLPDPSTLTASSTIPAVNLLNNLGIGSTGQPQNSLLSQLLDGIALPSRTSIVPVTSANSTGMTMSTSNQPLWNTSLPSLLSQSQGLQMVQQGLSGSNAAISQAGQATVVTTTAGGGAITAPSLAQAIRESAMDTSTPTNPFDGLEDFSTFFSPQYSSSGVSGATPQMSSLTFGPPPPNSQPLTLADLGLPSAGSLSTSTMATTAAATQPETVPLTNSAITSVAGSNAHPQPTSAAVSASTDPEIPEGVDPSFLAALPEHIRQEVISEQLRLQRIRRRAEEQAQASVSMNTGAPSGESSSALDVNPEFLAALPPNIQEEVLAQQRAEQARLVAQQSSTTNPDLPVDPNAFFATMPSSLRQQVLADMDDSMLAVLPPDLLTEAQELRRNMEERHRRRLQEPSIIGFLRDCGLARRLGTRYAISTAQRQNQLSFNVRGGAGTSSQGKMKGRFMLDPEAITCLLVLLFIDDPKLNTARLHRVLRNLCYHAPTRSWLIRALISIVQKASDSTAVGNHLAELCVEEKDKSSSHSTSKDKGKGKKSANSSTSTPTSSTSCSISDASSHSSPSLSSFQHQSSSPFLPPPSDAVTSQPPTTAMPMQTDAISTNNLDRRSSLTSSTSPHSASGGYWLSISLEAALGCRANVFQILRSSGGKKHTSSSPSPQALVSIHPQASPVVCRHTLDTLISLAKIFPSHFLPVTTSGSSKGKDSASGGGGSGSQSVKEEENTPVTTQVPKKALQTNSSKLAEQSSLSSSSTSSSSASVAGSSSSSRDARAENDFWNILVRLDHLSGKSKGKGVQRSHSLGASEGEGAAVDYSSSALGQLMGMLCHPVVRRSQLLTDRLLRLLGLISVSLPNSSGNQAANVTSRSVTTPTTASIVINALSRAAGTTSASATSPLTTALSTRVAAPAIPSTPIPPVTSALDSHVAPASVAPQLMDQQMPPVTTSGSGVAATDPTQSTDKPMSEDAGGMSKSKTCEKLDNEEDSQPILQNELRLAVEVLTSKSCSEEGLEDATNLLLQLSWANGATRAAVLNLLLSGARHLGLIVCGHIQELLQQVRQLSCQTEQDDGGEGGAGGSTSSTLSKQQVVKGVMADRFTSGASVVLSAPTPSKTGRELHLPSMSQLTAKTSSQQFLLRILKVIIQLQYKKSQQAHQPSGQQQPLSQVIDRILYDDRSYNLPVLPAATGPLTGPLNLSSSEQTQRDTTSGETNDTAQSEESAMEVDAGPGVPSSKGEDKSEQSQSSTPRLSEQLSLDELWDVLGECLAELSNSPDHHAVLILQPAVEAFFIVHAGEKMSKPSEQTSSRREDQLAHLNLEMAPPSPAMAGSSSSDVLAGSPLSRDTSASSVAVADLPADTQKFLKFAETHRTVLNQILRQSTLPLSDGPFSVLVDHMRILDFDVKRRYFRQELDRLNEGARREDLPVHIRRSHVFEDSFRELFRRTPEEWKQRFYIVFEGEEGQDAGGLLREWYIIISHEIFNQNYALFRTSPGDRVTYTISPSSHCNSNHLSYFKFVGRIIAKAVYDNKLLDCYFTRSFYKHMLGLAVKYNDMESEDYAFYQGLHFLLENHVADIGYDLFFSTEVQEFGVTETRDLLPDGSNTLVSEDNKREYVKRVCQMRMTGAIRTQLNAFLEGFYDIIPKKLVSIFTEQELELLISGLPTIDIDDLKANTEYIKYQATSLQIQWFWRALRSFDQAERANFLQFVTGTSKVPLGGFANLEGMNGTQKFQIHRDDRSTDRLPSAHTCFNQLDLPAYETYDKLRKMMLLAVMECSEGFGLA